ncbi:MAG: zinc-dependent metalloprotease [Saprospiraceae bacterium]|nr:zinc-dependent metalloprotease [Saprospiraceae bacterium]
MTRIFIVILFFIAPGLQAQNPQSSHWCGTQDGKVAWLQEYQANPKAFSRSADTLYLPVTIHLVGTASGAGYFGLPDLLDAFCTLNRDFETVNIQFYLEGGISYIPNNTYYNHNFDTGSEMMTAYNVPNTINCYISNSPGENLCGYSAYNLGVALAKSCIQPDDHTWSHELGHFLSLPHPFYGWEGYDHDYGKPAPEQINGNLVERVDGVNCDIAGDGFCDTPPDYLNYRWNCNTLGESIVLQTDPLGVKLKSDGSLIMSYSSDVCSYRFSDEQIAAMQANALTDKAEFLYDQTVRYPVYSGPVVPVFPGEGDTITTFNEIPFVWEPMPEATHYIVEYSINPGFNSAVFQFSTVGNSWVSSKLVKNKTYYWRLRPYNAQHTCEASSDIHSFTTGDQLSTGVEDLIDGLSAVHILPNPVHSGAPLSIRISSERSLELNAILMTSGGNEVALQQWQLNTGLSNLQIDVPALPSGLYVLKLRTAQGQMVRKVLITQ